LAVGRDDAHDGVHVLLKAHIEHPISLVEHCVAHLMREPIGPHQCSSAYVVQSRDLQSVLISAHQCSSVLISAHQCSSVLISVRRPVARRLPRESRAVGPAWRGAHAPVGRGGRWRRGEHLHARGAGRGAHAPVISGHGRSWAVMGGHQRPSEVIRGHQWQSSPPRPAARFASPEAPPRTRRRTRCPRVDLRQ